MRPAAKVCPWCAHNESEHEGPVCALKGSLVAAEIAQAWYERERANGHPGAPWGVIPVDLRRLYQRRAATAIDAARRILRPSPTAFGPVGV